MHVQATPATSPATGRAWWLVLAYPVLALTGALLHRPALALLGIGVAAGAPCLAAPRRLASWLGWLVIGAGLAWLARENLSVVAMGSVPVLVQVALAMLFGASLLPGRCPLVARVIDAIEGPERLQSAGVASYARGVTWFWALLLAAQAVLVGTLTACSMPGPLHCRWLPAGGWVQGYLQFGGYAVLGLAFAGEYGWRRWRLRHLAHPTFAQFLRRLAVAWPALVRERRAR